MKNTLWTKNFTIITIGTIISMLGNAISGFAISLLVLDYTGSTLLYVIFMVVYNLPKVVMPLAAGPYLDRFSRTKVIYTLDFISAGIYAAVFFILRSGYFSYGPFLLLCVLIGSIDSVYQVAYDSLYPMLVSEGNFTKAYSISSLIYPLAAMMVPVASYVYEYVGLTPLFAFNALTFLVAAVFETQIRVDESQIGAGTARVSFRQLKEDFSEGLAYIRREKGLAVITAYFFVSMLTGSGSGALWLPYFRTTAGLGVTLYSYVSACNVLGRLVGGGVQYRIAYPPKKKFAIALFVYTAITVMEASFLFLPVLCMMLLMFVHGMLGVTSFNIRISATQSYVPNDYRGRFNGTFQMLTTLGSIIGQLSAGALAEVFPDRSIIVAFMTVNLIAVYAIVYRGREHVKAIYNRAV